MSAHFFFRTKLKTVKKYQNLIIFLTMSYFMMGCIVSNTDFFEDKTIAPFETIDIVGSGNNFSLIKKNKTEKKYLLFNNTVDGTQEEKFIGEVKIASLDLLTKNADLVKNVPKDTFLFNLILKDKNTNVVYGVVYGVAFFNFQKKEGFLSIGDSLSRIALSNNLCDKEFKRCQFEKIDRIYDDITFYHKGIDSSLEVKSFATYKNIMLDIIKSYPIDKLDNMSKVTLTINKTISLPNEYSGKNKNNNNSGDTLNAVNRSLEDEMSKVESELANLQKKNDDINKKRGNINKEITNLDASTLNRSRKVFDLMISTYKGRYTNEVSIKLNKACYDLYREYAKLFVEEEKLISLENKYHGYSKKTSTDFYTYVQNQYRKTGLSKNQCGFFLAEEIGKKPNALEYTLADFAAYHNLNMEDKDSAYMIGLIYYIGIGVNRDKKLAAYWFQQAKLRDAPVDSYLKSLQ